MQIQIRARHVEVTEVLHAQGERRLGFVLGRFGARIGRVVVRFSDPNGHRGGRETRCQIDVGLRPSGSVRSEDTDADLLVAVHRAADEEAYFARLEMERRTQALAAQESQAAEAERQRLLAMAQHHCPKCGALLVTLHHRGVEIEQCSHCQGVWLDRGELEQVLASEPAQGFFGSLKRLWESGEGKQPCQRTSR